MTPTSAAFGHAGTGQHTYAQRDIALRDIALRDLAPVAGESRVFARGFTIPSRPVTTIGVLFAVALCAALLLTGHAGALTYVYPGASLAVGALLYVYAPARFLAWVLLLWMISPFVRRVVDAQHGWNPQNPILLAPLLVSALCLVDAARHLPRLTGARVLPAVLAMSTIALGVAVGLTQSAPTLVLYAALTWLAPIAVGLVILLHPERHEAYHTAIVRTLIGGVIVLGVYGVLQFVSPPIWDRIWMINSQMDSIGSPTPMRVRVFSMLNAPGPLAQFLSAALLILLAHRSLWKWPAVLAGAAIFLLSLARSAWVGFVLGLALLLVVAPHAVRRATLTLCVLAVVAVSSLSLAPLTPPMEAMRTTITKRVTTLGELSMDVSYRARQQLIPAVLADISEHPAGSGLGATLVGGAHGSASSRLADQGLYLDNGFLELLLVFGWVGGPLFLLSAISAMLSAWTVTRCSNTGFGYLAAAVALLSQVAGGTIFAGVGGGMFWMAVAMARTAPRASAPRASAPRALAPRAFARAVKAR